MGREDAGHWVALLAGLHDIGKATPAFVSYLLPEQRARVLGAAYRMPALPVAARDAPHGAVSALVLEPLLSTRLSVSLGVARDLALVVGGHHGIFPSRASLERIALRRSAVGTGAWHVARVALFEDLSARLAIRDWAPPRRLTRPAAMLVAGLVSVADWIGSSTEFLS
jgi:CRISPR-associated endonuclease/helicase Cas3